MPSRTTAASFRLCRKQCARRRLLKINGAKPMHITCRARRSAGFSYIFSSTLYRRPPRAARKMHWLAFDVAAIFLSLSALLFPKGHAAPSGFLSISPSASAFYLRPHQACPFSRFLQKRCVSAAPFAPAQTNFLNIKFAAIHCSACFPAFSTRRAGNIRLFFSKKVLTSIWRGAII